FQQPFGYGAIAGPDFQNLGRPAGWLDPVEDLLDEAHQSLVEMPVFEVRGLGVVVVVGSVMLPLLTAGGHVSGFRNCGGVRRSSILRCPDGRHARQSPIRLRASRRVRAETRDSRRKME